jgi:GNAT superfamily N-acetyltransferase
MPDEPVYRIRRLASGDAEALLRFYNGMSASSKRLFHPLGDQTDPDTCREIVEANMPAAPERYDLIVTCRNNVVGWCFLMGLGGPEPSLGLGIADAHQGRGLGRQLMERVMAWARGQRLPAVSLTVVHNNRVARRLYEHFGFVEVSQRVSEVDRLHYVDMRAELEARNRPIRGEP